MADRLADGFGHILNWRLLAGSHQFPGPDGGTCINEAALVAAGLPYRAIRSSADCPPCFSHPLAAYALGLNDAMPDAERNRLMAFVLRLSGSADRPEIEAARTRHLAVAGISRILGPLCGIAGLSDLAALCAAADTVEEALAAARAASWRGGVRAEEAGHRRLWLAGARAAALARTATAAIRAIDDPRCAAEIAEGAAPFLPGTWQTACAILEEALAIGRQAPNIDLMLAGRRLDAARGLQPA
ncbi:hypothetical protein [Methylobacterium dankookense]|uniref:Uncharacterized protein n=1 Tax=Methylobacterium dankookense TaxID=560405 RepID=A0A564FV38_9HYPH|nr:hypothetical protein [Methylobacterium dankookense]GJD59311.1 hypothetical protein IFDJLNFL_5239 [Methylobacterium dankookense]VUF11902.1 hypothetical protein MTDSW087_01587 [Methylobacterium dankookense]